MYLSISFFLFFHKARETSTTQDGLMDKKIQSVGDKPVIRVSLQFEEGASVREQK
jgi:hypothetical protein